MNRKKLALSVLALLAAAALLFGLSHLTRPQTQPGAKQISVSIVHSASAPADFTIQTDRAFLGDALLDEALISGEEGPYGLFITQADGEQADSDQQQWWCITKGGGPVNTGISATPIADGDCFELTLKTGY